MYHSISLVVPAYNEESNIGVFLNSAIKSIEKLVKDYEIIIINDGSTDRTKDIVNNFLRKNNRIKQIIHNSNLGYGDALRTGFRISSKELVFFTDSDNQFDLSEIAHFYEEIGNNDYVIGYRKNRQDSIIRRINGRLWTKLVNVLYGLDVKDVNCAFKMFKRDIIKSLKLKSSGASINAELLNELMKKKYKYTQIPVSHLPRSSGNQTGAKITVIVDALKNVLISKK